MLVSLTFSNFYSFAEETTLSFEVGKKPSASRYDIDLPDHTRLNKVAAVVGANGAGKTQLIKPLTFLSWFVTHSFLRNDPDLSLPYKAHALHRESPTRFELCFIHQGEHYRYRLSLFKGRVQHESLHRKTSHLYSYVFSRDVVEGQALAEFKQKGFGFAAQKAREIRPTASLISAAHSYDVSAASALVHYFEGYRYNFNVVGRDHFHHGQLLESARFFHQHADLHLEMQTLLCEFDLGISEVQIKQVQAPPLNEDGEVPQTTFVPFGIHGQQEQAFALPFFEESSGTQSAFVLLHKVLPVLQGGGVAIIDEIDNDLHPHMLPKLMSLFKDAHSNPHQAQLIFTCHTPEVLNLLRKHQVMMVEKVDHQSEAWRLDEVQGVRADDNLYAKYMAGALGAVPNL